eukprot:1895109-Ditylum_brightwellii.AAC.1
MFYHKVGEKGKAEREDRSGETTSSDEDGPASKNSSGNFSSWTNVDNSGATSSPTRHDPALLDDHPSTLDNAVHCGDDDNEDSVLGESNWTPPASLSDSWMNIKTAPETAIGETLNHGKTIKLSAFPALEDEPMSVPTTS